MREMPPLVAYCTRSTLVICSALLNPAPGSADASPINVSRPAVGNASPLCSMATSTRSGKSETITLTVGSPFAWPCSKGNVSRHASCAADVSPCWPASDNPQRCEACCTTAPIAPKKRVSSCRSSSVRAGSSLILDCSWTSAVRRPLPGRRRPRGSRDNSTFHPRPAVCCIAIGRNSRTSRRCTAILACHTANKV